MKTGDRVELLKDQKYYCSEGTCRNCRQSALYSRGVRFAVVRDPSQYNIVDVAPLTPNAPCPHRVNGVYVADLVHVDSEEAPADYALVVHQNGDTLGLACSACGVIVHLRAGEHAKLHHTTVNTVDGSQWTHFQLWSHRPCGGLFDCYSRRFEPRSAGAEAPKPAAKKDAPEKLSQAAFFGDVTARRKLSSMGYETLPWEKKR